jgi:TolB-like protein
LVSAQDYNEQVRALSSRLVARIPQNQIATVLDFTDLNGNSTQLGRLLAQDMFDQMLVLAPYTTWIDPSRRDFVLKENKLAADRLTDPATQKRLGKLLNVGLIVVGTTVNLGDSVRLQVRVIDVETTRVWSSGSVTLQLQSEMLRLDSHSVSGAPSTSGASPSGYVGSRRFESAGSMEVSLQSVTMLSNRKIEFSIGLRNTKPNEVNVMVALKAMHSGGVADFWKMFPTATSRVITSQGDEYSCRKARFNWR